MNTATLKKDIAIVILAIAGAITAMRCGAGRPVVDPCKDKHGDTIVGCATSSRAAPWDIIRQAFAAVVDNAGNVTISHTTGDMDMNSHPIHTVGPPTVPTDVSDLSTVDSRMMIATVASTVALPTYSVNGPGTVFTATSNGAFPVVDGVSLIAGTSRFNTILFRHGAAAADNCFCKLTQQGDAGAPWILTRDLSADSSAELVGSKVRVLFGNHFAGSEWELPTSSAITLGVTGLYWQPTNSIPFPFVGVDRSDDFDGISTSTTVAAYMPGGFGWLFSPTGTSANITVGTSTHDALGYASLGTGSTSTGAAVLGSALGNGTVLFTTGDLLYFLVRFNETTLSDGTNTYKSQAGLGNVSGVAQTNGLYFEYDQSTQTTLRCVAMKASSPTVATGPTVVAGTNNVGEIIKAAGDTTVHMFVDGTECGTGFTSGLVPSGVPISPYLSIVKSLGGTARQHNIDLVRFRDVVTGTRF